MITIPEAIAASSEYGPKHVTYWIDRPRDGNVRRAVARVLSREKRKYIRTTGIPDEDLGIVTWPPYENAYQLRIDVCIGPNLMGLGKALARWL